MQVNVSVGQEPFGSNTAILPSSSSYHAARSVSATTTLYTESGLTFNCIYSSSSAQYKKVFCVCATTCCTYIRLSCQLCTFHFAFSKDLSYKRGD